MGTWASLLLLCIFEIVRNEIHLIWFRSHDLFNTIYSPSRWTWDRSIWEALANMRREGDREKEEQRWRKGILEENIKGM